MRCLDVADTLQLLLKMQTDAKRPLMPERISDIPKQLKAIVIIPKSSPPKSNLHFYDHLHIANLGVGWDGVGGTKIFLSVCKALRHICTAALKCGSKSFP